MAAAVINFQIIQVKHYGEVLVSTYSWMSDHPVAPGTVIDVDYKWAHSINLDLVDFTDFLMSWRIRLILISFSFRRFANQWNLRNPAPELDFSQISLISSCAQEPESWTWRLKAAVRWSNVLRIVVCSWPRLALTCFEFDPGDVGREGKETEIEGSLQLMFGPQAQTKQTIFFYACWKASAMSKAFSPGSRRRSLQGGRRWPGGGCSAVARRRDGVWKRHSACTWDGSLSHDELVKILGEEASTRPSICAGTGLHVLPILSIVIYGALVRVRLAPFLSRRQCSAAFVDPLRCFRPVASRRHVRLPWQKKKITKCRSNNFVKSTKSKKS